MLKIQLAKIRNISHFFIGGLFSLLQNSSISQWHGTLDNEIKHFLLSAHVSPVYPEAQKQSKEPGLLLHVPPFSQMPSLSSHSLVSEIEM